MGTEYSVKSGEGIQPISLTTAQRLALTPTNGLIIYDTDLDQLFVYDGSAWATAKGGLSTGNEVWVDAVNGDDTTGTADRSDLPFLTIAAAISASSSGDSIIARPGTYAESGLVVPADTTLIGQGGYEVTFITGAAITGNRVTLSSGSAIIDFTVTIPTDATNAVEYAGGGGTVAGARFVKFNGQTSALGSGLANTGAGKLIAFEIRYGVLDCANILLCTAGILAMQSLHVPGTGTIQRGAKVENGRLQALDINIGNANVIYGVEIGSAGVAVLISLNLFNLKNGMLFSANDVQVDALGGKIQTTSTIGGSYGGGINSFTGRSVVVDSALDLASATIRITAQMEPNFVWNNTLNPNAAGADFTISLIQGDTTERTASERLFGVDSQIGFPERGAKFMTGEGGANPTFNNVVQIDAAGTGFTDITDEASTKAGSSFTFLDPTGTLNESIAWCSNRRDTEGNLVKNWGIVMHQLATASGNTAEYTFEIYTGAATYDNTWTEVGVQAISVAEQYNYADAVFLRSNSQEQLRLGVDNNTTWNTTTINSVEGYYARVRISFLPGLFTATPTFEQLLTSPSHMMWNEQGQLTAHGLAMWRSDLFGIGNVWGEISGGGAGDANIAVGSGGGATGWTQKIKKGLLNSNGDSISFQFTIPDALCTAYPLYFNLTYSLDASTPAVADQVDMILSTLVLGVGGVLIASSLDVKVPVARTPAAAEVFTSKAATTFPVSTIVGVIAESPNVMQFGPLDISNYYDGDLIAIRLELDDDGSQNADITIWALSVEGVRYTNGKILQD